MVIVVAVDSGNFSSFGLGKNESAGFDCISASVDTGTFSSEPVDFTSAAEDTDCAGSIFLSPSSFVLSEEASVDVESKIALVGAAEEDAVFKSESP